jgi:membrane protein required for colicin V production
MNLLDIIIIVILGYCLVRGIFRGLIKEVSGIIGVLGGFYAAYSYYQQLAQFLSQWISDTSIQNILSFMLLFCAVLIIVSIIGIVVKYLLNIAFLGWTARITGGIFGILKGVLISCVIIFSLTAFLPKGAPIVKESFLAPYATMVSETMAKVVPEELKAQISDKIGELKKVWKN